MKKSNIDYSESTSLAVAVFTFHISRLELASIEHQAMSHLLSICMARSLDFKVVHSPFSSTDMSIKIYVFNTPIDVYERFNVYNLRPVY